MKLTIFTPSYNRAELLPRLYESLLRQKRGDFEWLIVDDGSTDETAGFAGAMINDGKIPVRFIKKANGGKHTAHNVAVDNAAGEWFFCVDSDDIVADGAVERILSEIELAEAGISSFAAYKADRSGQLLCGTLSPQMRCGLYTMVKQGAWGEYALIFRTSVLRDYPFPEIKGERFVTESVLYDRLELDGYSVKPIDVVLEVCEYQPDGLSSGAYCLLLDNPTGYQIYHSQRIDLVDTVMEKLRHGICYWAFRILSGNKEYTYRGRHRWLNAVTVLPGIAAAYYYKIRGKFQR